MEWYSFAIISIVTCATRDQTKAFGEIFHTELFPDMSWPLSQGPMKKNFKLQYIKMVHAQVAIVMKISVIIADNNTYRHQNSIKSQIKGSSLYSHGLSGMEVTHNTSVWGAERDLLVSLVSGPWGNRTFPLYIS